jgi:S1-C subfamily serine protease
MVSKKNFIASALAAALVGGGLAIARESQNSIVPVQARATEPGSASRASLRAFADLAERVSPAVVNIKVTAVARTGVTDESFGENLSIPGFSQSCSPTTPRVQATREWIRVHHPQGWADPDQ